MKRRESLLLLLLALTVTSAVAAGTPIREEVNTLVVSDASAINAQAPSFVAPLGTRESVQIRAGTEKDVASIQIGSRMGRTAWNALVKAPVDKEDKTARVVTLDGLSDAITLESTFNVFLLRRITNAAARRSRELCIQAGKLRGFSPEQTQTRFFDEGKCDSLTNPANALDDDFYSTTPSNADRKRVSAALKSLRAHYLRTRFDGEHIPMLRVSGSVGTEEFEYVEEGDLAEQDEDRTEWALGVGFTLLNINDGWAAGVGYRREEIYEPSESSVVCPLDVQATSLRCDEVRVGGPVAKSKDLVTLALDYKRANWATSPIVTYDFDGDDYGIALPLYLIRDDKRHFTGGISFGWESQEKDLSVQIFVGVPFSLFN